MNINQLYSFVKGGKLYSSFFQFKLLTLSITPQKVEKIIDIAHLSQKDCLFMLKIYGLGGYKQ